MLPGSILMYTKSRVHHVANLCSIRCDEKSRKIWNLRVESSVTRPYGQFGGKVVYGPNGRLGPKVGFMTGRAWEGF